MKLHILWLLPCLPFVAPTLAPAETAFDLAVFHQRAAAMRHTIIQTPACVDHKGVRGEFVMEVPAQDGLPFEVTTIVGPGGIYSSLTTPGERALSEADAQDVGGVFNDQAEALVRVIIDRCKSEDA